MLRLLAFLTARTVNAVTSKSAYGASRDAALHADQLAISLAIDPSCWFVPTAENYFSRIPKDKILEALTEAGKDAGPARQGLKKAELAKLADSELDGTGWLPKPLRVFAPRDVSESPGEAS